MKGTLNDGEQERDKRQSSRQFLSRWRAVAFPLLSPIYLLAIYGLPTALVLPWGCAPSSHHWFQALAMVATWPLAFILIAGSLSLPHQSSVRPGKFKRDVGNPLYFHRRLYGLCWTAVYYNKPIYFICLSAPFLKWLTFRLFGYRGPMDFTVYPDTWIRDLPLLYLETGSYVSNRATLGTNIVLSNGFLLVDRIRLGRDALVGHMAMLAPGVELEAEAEIGVGAGIGIKAKLGQRAFVGPCSVVEHGVRFGAAARLGSHSFIGSGTVVPAATRLPAGTILGPRTRFAEGSPQTARVPKACYLQCSTGSN